MKTQNLESSFALPKWLRIMASAVGFIILALGLGKLFSHSIAELKLMFPYILVGVVCFSIGGISTSMSLSPEGVVHVRSVWGKKKEETLSWDVINSVVLQRKKNMFYARFFKENGKGWQIPFKISQLEAFNSYMKRYHSDINIEDITDM
ncbi:MAG: hypothetical protein WCQ97_03690 [Aminobacterium sp.]|jgi:hypothetical protein|uniref:Uncharacterized protein n=1 Tax=bioreactor metagenome TaxID=1076179 RepID=A0A645FVA4_9ZZZZ|nr:MULTISPECIES: hypothetical protein [unclassified Aminobacterium]MDD2207489.1 hypothetical protein [Aminobacterium sp.]MDD3708119.1 hypothetical protein [Aminobacterium sp.]MDD4228738.1 hypothetical protein [Aminobacterium sp.]MDD4551752.1 hypothetical protein [Aminobacterium sp.]MEA4878368.1 hypothetical protein [Aminobacterium sp.]